MIDTIKHDAAIYQYFILIIVVLEGMFLSGKFKMKGKVLTYKGIHPGHILAVIVFILLANSDAPDRSSYRLFFEDTIYYGFYIDRSPGWSVINYIVSRFTHNVSIFFLIASFIHVFLVFCFCKKLVRNYSLLFLATISFMGFYSMGANTLKSGVSLALCLWVFYSYRSKLKFCLLALLSIMFHYTAVFPIFSFYLYKFVKSEKIALCIWACCLILSYFIGPIIISYVGTFITDEYTSDYFKGSSESYKTGFRYDFILYSLVPMVAGYYYIAKKKYFDEFWHRLYITYILTNAIWLLLIWLPYTDRFAYLSWFLFPYILLFPFLKGYPNKKNLYTAYKIMFALWLFNFLLFLR